MVDVPSTVSDERLVQLLSDLVSIESVNPIYPGGERGESGMAAYVEDHCRRLGLDVALQAVLPDRENVVAGLRVPGAKRTLLFEAHMDTVEIASMGDRALQPEVRDGRLYGRGSCDTKGSMAAMLTAMEALLGQRRDLAINVLFLASVDEEFHFRGVTAFCQSPDYSVDAAVVGEPTDLRVVVAHKGAIRWRLSTVGRAAHSARPEEGNNAIDQMSEVLRALRDLKPRWQTRQHPLVGAPTLSVGRIWGGVGVNIVPDRCTIEIDRRVIPGEEPMAALAEIDALLAELCAGHPAIMVEREEPFVVHWPLDTPAGAAIATAAGRACRDVDVDPTPMGVPYGTDASELSRVRHIPSIVLGPGSIAHAHTNDEFVPIADLVAAAEIYRRTALHFSDKA